MYCSLIILLEQGTRTLILQLRFSSYFSFKTKMKISLSQADRRFLAQNSGSDEPFNESERFQVQSTPFSESSSSSPGDGKNESDYEQGYVTNQAGVAKDMMTFLHKFYENFPEKRQADLYLTSESYGGTSLPKFLKWTSYSREICAFYSDCDIGLQWVRKFD